MPARTVLAAQEQRGEDHQHDDRRDDPGDLHPSWCARFRAPHIGWLHPIGLAAQPVLLVIPTAPNLSIHDVAANSLRHQVVRTYTASVPKLWNETIQAHRRDVRQAILDTTAALVAEHGLLSVTMSQIAEETGIGRATLYKYFPDVEAILFAWHERQIANHLEELEEVTSRGGTALERLEGVLERFAHISHEARRDHDSELARFLRRDEHVAQGEDRVQRLIAELIREGSNAGDLRDDVPPDELATYCVQALGAAASLRSRAAVRRLVDVTLSGLITHAD
jgi:AcrR family transcriptional regulator